ncbi:MAG TPA: hypothetical protein VF690_19060 [Hymenobacter sp.]|jgi:hypothetical protein
MPPLTTFTIRLRPERFNVWQPFFTAFRRKGQLRKKAFFYTCEGLDSDGLMTLEVYCPDAVTVFALGVHWGMVVLPPAQ